MTTPGTIALSGRKSFTRNTPSTPPDPDPGVVLVSSYGLDSGSAVDSVSGIDGTIAGDWASFGLGSLVVGDSGGSFYKSGGSARVELPASQAAHNLGALSIGLYYQRSSASDKHILLAVGDGTQVGDLSIEVFANGRIRGYHVGSGGLRYFGDAASGIVGTNIVVGTAVRIVATFGPAGAHLFIDNTEVGSIVQNTNGWNNARVKYLGVWVDAVLAPADGIFDLLRIWSGQLSAVQVAALAAAQSIAGTDVSLGTFQVFSRSTVQVTGLAGWPGGRTPQEIVSQGPRCSGYVRRAWKPTLHNGTYIDFVTGWSKTTAVETIRLKLDNDNEINLTYQVGHTLPSPGSGGVTRTLDRSNASPNGTTTFNSWAAAIAALRTNDVLVVRAPTGTWTDSGGHSIPNYVYDVSTNPAPAVSASGVVIVAHPDDVAAGRRPVIWRNAGRYARFKYDPSAAWRVHQDLGGGRVIYESVATSPQPAHSYFGAYRDVGGDWMALYCYQAITDTTDRSNVMHDTIFAPANGTAVTHFRGPGLIYNKLNNRFEVRLNPPVEQSCNNPSVGAPFPPWAWQNHYPPSTDARQCEIIITDGGTFAANYLLDMRGRGGWKFYNLDFVYGNVGIRAEQLGGMVAPQFYGCNWIGGAPSDFNNDGLNIDNTGSAILALDMSSGTSTDFLFDRCNVEGHMPPWASFGEGKGFEGAGGLSTRREFLSGSSARVVFRYCDMKHWWHPSWQNNGSSFPVIKWHHHHCRMRQYGQDGGILVPASNTSDFNVNRCFIEAASIYGFTSTGGTGTNRYFSFNVDLRLHTLMCGQPGFVKRCETEGSANTNAPFFVNSQSVAHGGRSEHSDRKYYNTHVGTQHTNGVEFFDSTEGCGAGHGPDSRGTNHRIFNCIAAVYPGVFNWPAGKSALVAVYSRENSNSQYNNNVLFKSAGMITPSLGSNTFAKVNSGSGSGTLYASLSALQAGEGFETNSVSANPQFAVTPAYASSNPYAAGGAFTLGNYLLGASSPARTGARNINDQSLPDYDFETLTTWVGGTNAPWRGALQPDVPAIEQEVGICGPLPPEIV